MKKSTASKKHDIPKKTATNQKLKSGICTTISKIKKVLNHNGVIRINIPETGIFLNVNLLIFNVKTPSM